MTEEQQLIAPHELIAQYVETGSEAAFRELVARYVDLVYSAAIRLVNGDSHLAEDVTQTVFVDLAREARKLSREVRLGGWLHRHTCFVAAKTLRGERRRLTRERLAVEMNNLEDHSAANLASVAPVLDEAINQLGSEDRTAILLRFFEQCDFRAVGEAMGSTEDAARKRVDRALEKLEVLLKRRGVALSAAALGSALGTQAVTAAPAGLAVSISTVALAGAGAAAGGGTTLTILKVMTLNKMTAGIITVVLAAGITIPIVLQQRAQNKLREANDALRQKEDQNVLLAAENARLASEKARATKAAAVTSTATPNDAARELLKARGEVGRLRREVAEAKAPGPSALSGITANPEMAKMIRDQQKMGMSMIYSDFTNRMKLPQEQAEKLVSLLADDVMENIDRIQEVLRDKKSPEEMEAVFAQQETALQNKVKDLLGPEGYEKYHDYTVNLASHLTAEQFKGMLTGDSKSKDAKAKQVYEAMQQETKAVLTEAGLPADYQTVPTMNFRNFASEAARDQTLKLLDTIYERVSAKADSFLSPAEVKKFGEFRKIAINNNKMMLALNQKLMAPSGK